MPLCKCKNPLVVVAFDFGTTYSGYAFSYVTDPNEVQINKTWIPRGSYSQLVTHKTPTSVLLDNVGGFHSFGYEAEDEFACRAEENKHQGWILFRHFKMILHNDEDLSRKSTIEDLEGKPHPAMQIFSMAIRYLHRHAKKAVKLQRPNFPETDFQYVITVPATWDIRAKRFMREAAHMAGLDGNRLELVHEPEAAALWCCHDAKKTHPETDIKSSETKFMVIDLGGGTADISVSQISSDGSIKMIHKATGGPYGGIFVDHQFLNYLKDKFGHKALQNVRKNQIGDYFDICREFENKKRSTSYRSTNEIKIRTSLALRQIAIRTMSYLKRIVSSRDNNPHLYDENMRIKSKEAEAWFEKPVTFVIQLIKSLLEQVGIKDNKTLFLVGGFGESQYGQDRFREQLGGHILIVPKDPGLVVLKGAVLYGHNPGKVACRVMTHTYGIAKCNLFDEEKHPIEKKTSANGKLIVDNIFHIFVKTNEKVSLDQGFSFNGTPRDIYTDIPVFRTSSENPKYTTDPGCELLARLKIKNIDTIPLADQRNIVTFIFGNTELFMKVYHDVTG